MVLIDSDFSNNTDTRGMRNQIGFLERNQRAGEEQRGLEAEEDQPETGCLECSLNRCSIRYKSWVLIPSVLGSQAGNQPMGRRVTLPTGAQAQPL